MSATLSIDFGNSYTKVGIRRDPNAVSQVLRNDVDLIYDEDHLCIPTDAARIMKDGKEFWLFGTDVKNAAKGGSTKVFRNWKPRFFRGDETHLIDGKNGPDSDWDIFTDTHLETLLRNGTLVPEKVKEAKAVLKRRKQVPTDDEQDFDFKEIGKGFFSWLRSFVEPYCELHGIGTTAEIPVRITMPTFGTNSSSQSRLTLQSILKKAGWIMAEKQPALPEPVANLIGIFTSGKNKIWRAEMTLPFCYSLVAMMGETSLYRAIRKFQTQYRDSSRPIYWIMIADLGGYTTDFAMVGFNLSDVSENINIDPTAEYAGKRLLAHYSEPRGIHDLDKQVRDVLSEAHRKAFESLIADVDGRRINGFHRRIYQESQPYNTGQGSIGDKPQEQRRIEEVIRGFADQIADYAEQFLLQDQYDFIDELILTGGGCNIPPVREAICRKLKKYHLKNSHIPHSNGFDLPDKCEKIERLLVRGATALGASSVFFDYD